MNRILAFVPILDSIDFPGVTPLSNSPSSIGTHRALARPWVRSAIPLLRSARVQILHQRKPGKGRTEIHRGPTRDPGATGNVGCYFIFAALLVIGLIVVLLEVFG